MTVLGSAAVDPNAGLLVLERAVVGPHSGEIVPEAEAVNESAGKTKGNSGTAGTSETLVSRAMRPLCSVEAVCPSKPCLVLNPRWHVLRKKRKEGFVVGTTLAFWPFGNMTKR